MAPPRNVVQSSGHKMVGPSYCREFGWLTPEKILKSSRYKMVGKSYSGEFGKLRPEILLRVLDTKWLEKA